MAYESVLSKEVPLTADLALQIAGAVMEQVGLDFLDLGCYVDPKLPEDQAWVYEIYGVQPGLKWALKVNRRLGDDGRTTEAIIFDASQVDLFKGCLEAMMQMNRWQEESPVELE